MLTISVRKLDGDVINITTDKKEKGEFVFDKVCESIDLVEKDYFGLQYEDKTGVTNWLDLSRRLGRLIKSDNAEFQFAVKFYPPDPSQLQEDVTRYQLCLQIRNDILSEKLLCSFVTYALLGSYLVQSELGDYSPEEYPDSSYLKNFRFSPEQTPELESKVMELHRTHKGQTPAEAELHYLENAKKLAMYGVDFHPAKDSEGVDITLGVCSTGLLVYRERLRINRFAWPKILKISYKRNYFYVKIRPGDYEPYENTVVFKLESHKAAKRLWNVCVEHHTFFRLMTPEDVARPGLIPGLSNKFPSLRKTHYQTKRNTIEREPPSSFRKSQRYPTSKSMDPLQPSNKEKDAKKRHTMPPENTQSPRKEKDDASVSASSQEGDFSLNERIPGAVPVLPMADFKKKDQKENGVTNESDEEKENRNLKENREEDKKKKSSGLGLFKRSEGKRDKLEEIGAKREYEYEYEEDTKKSPKGVSKGFSYERSSSKEGSQPSSPDKDSTKSPTKARTFAFNYAPETPESDKKSGFSSLFSKRKKKDETSETTPKTDEKRESPLAAFLPGKDKKSKVSLFKDKSKESPAKDSPSKDTSFKDNESPATDAKTKDKDSKSKDKSKSKDSKESPSKDDSPTKDKKDSLVRGLFRDSSKDKDSPKKDSSKDKDSSKKDSAKDKDSTAEKDSLKKGSTIDKDSAKNDSTKNLSKDSLLNDKDSKEKSKDKDSKDKSKDKDSKDKSKDSKDKAKDSKDKAKDSKDKAKDKDSKDKDSKDKAKDKDSKDKVKDKDSKDKTKDSKDKSKDKDSKDKAKDKDSKDKSKDKDSKEKVKDKESKDKAKDDSKDVSSDLDLSKESAGKDSSSKDKESLTKEKEDAKKDKSAAKSGFFGFKDKKKDSETFIGEERSPKGGLFGWRKTPTKKDEENDENKPKVVKTTTKQSVVKEGTNVTRNIEEKIEDLATGDVTLNTAESLLEDQGSSPYVTATAVTTRTAMTTEDIGKNEKTSQVEEKTVARTTTTSGTRQEQRVVTQEVRATTVVSEPQERRSSISSTSSDDSGTPIDGDVAPYYAVAPHQEPIVETEAVFLTPGTGVAPQTTATPFVSTSTNLIGPVASDTVVSGEIVSSQTITSKTRTVETVTYKTEKDGVVETRVEQKITIQSDGDPIDHDKALQEAIQEATAMNPDMQVEKIEIQQESLDQ